MTIEQKIEEAIVRRTSYHSTRVKLRHTFSHWFGTPVCSWTYPGYIYETINVDYLIRQADLVECLISNNEYVRGCKKWLMENR